MKNIHLPNMTMMPKCFRRLNPFFVSEPPRESRTISTPSGQILTKKSKIKKIHAKQIESNNCTDPTKKQNNLLNSNPKSTSN